MLKPTPVLRRYEFGEDADRGTVYLDEAIVHRISDWRMCNDGFTEVFNIMDGLGSRF